jgi:hypothetical protein
LYLPSAEFDTFSESVYICQHERCFQEVAMIAHKLPAFLLSLSVFFMSAAALNADPVSGAWGDKDQSNKYTFLQTKEFRFWGRKSIFAEGKINYTPVKADGVWAEGDGICWTDDQKQKKGNLMIYVDTLQCCMFAQMIAGKLVLTEIWSKGDDEFDICSNRVLNRLKEYTR